jgi:hypothetical protein
MVAHTTHMKDLRNRIRARLLGSARLSGMDSVKKRAIHDELIVGTCRPMVQYTQAKKANDEAGKLAVCRRAAETSHRVGLTPTSLKFKEDGTVSIDRRTDIESP